MGKTSINVQDGSKPIFFTKPFYALGSEIKGRAPGEIYMNENAVRARAGLLNLTAWAVLMILTNIERPTFILYSIAPVVLWDMLAASIFGLTPFSPYGIVGTLLTWHLDPIWKPAAPKRFAWFLGAIMVSVCIIAGSPLIRLKPLSLAVAATCVLLTWMEGILGFCIGCYMWNKVIAPLFGKEECVECKMEIPVNPNSALETTTTTTEDREFICSFVSKSVGTSNPKAKITIFSKESCPYCIKAKTLLKDKNYSFNEINFNNITDEDEKYKVLTSLKNMTGQTTVPNIFINGQHVGGYTELLALSENNQLNDLLINSNNHENIYDCMVIDNDDTDDFNTSGECLTVVTGSSDKIVETLV
eukprot:Pgem_evm1s366